MFDRTRNTRNNPTRKHTQQFKSRIRPPRETGPRCHGSFQTIKVSSRVVSDMGQGGPSRWLKSSRDDPFGENVISLARSPTEGRGPHLLCFIMRRPGPFEPEPFEN